MRSRLSVVLRVAVVAVLAVLSGCNRLSARRSDARFVEFTLPLKSYVSLVQRHGEEPPFVFPLLRLQLERKLNLFKP